MKVNCNPNIGDSYKSASQRTRAITEGWFSAEAYCLNCQSPRVDPTRPGTPYRDAICPICGLGYELKSARSAHTRTVQDGGYDSMMREIRSANPPALMLLHYDAAWSVRGLVAIHPVFLTPTVIRRRSRPHLRPHTGQEYWMCNLDLTVIPPDGKIIVIENGLARPEATVREEFARSKPLAEIPVTQRGWTALVLTCIRKLSKPEFTLADLYAHESAMQAAYPQNTHIRPKIRQQLQVLRDLGYLEFLSKRGKYLVLI